MAAQAGAYAHVNGNGNSAPSAAEEDKFFAQIGVLQDAVITGKHPTLTLSAAAIEQLKASLILPESPSNGTARVVQNDAAVRTNGFNASTNQAAHVTSTFPGLPGLQSADKPSISGGMKAPQTTQPPTGLDPIFLEKSDSLVRAEGQLKRQRIERDILDLVDRRRQTSGRDREMLPDAPSNFNLDKILAIAQDTVKPISGIKKAERAASVATSFDENDYYSSQVESDWSSDASSSKGSDRELGSFTADYERLEEPHGVAKRPASTKGKRTKKVKGPLPSASALPATKSRPSVFAKDADGVDEADDEDDDYSPPEPTAFDSFYEGDTTMNMQNGGGGDSDYEPGEITDEGRMEARHEGPKTMALASPQVPIIRNHLTHIAAPQPNRVSPLAVQKRPSIELELVNGRPEIVQKHMKRQYQMMSRPSSASPSGPGTGYSAKKDRKVSKKKRKREPDHGTQGTRSKKQRERQHAQSPPSPMHRDPYIKAEPMSPPPLASVPAAPQYGRYPNTYAQPIEIDLDSPHYAPQPQYTYVSAPRYEPAPQPNSPAMRLAPVPGYRAVPRDSQDLRRVATLHHAQRPASPPVQRVYSPATAYSAVERTYIDSRPASVAPGSAEMRYQARPSVQYDLNPEPTQLREYREASPVLMPPPAAAPRQIVVDQYGNRYYAAEPAPPTRASAAPYAPHASSEMMYERAPSRMSVMSVPQAPPPPQSMYYEPTDARMAPPAPPARRQVPAEAPVEYVDSNGYRMREYSTRPAETQRYSVAPTSPVYQQTPQWDQMPPPSARSAAREPMYDQMPPPPAPQPPQQTTSPIYAPPPRAYSVVPEGYNAPQAGYVQRQASVAPVQYIRQDMQPPVRTGSAIPGSEYGAPAYQQRAPTYAPQPVRYMDEYGREVIPRDVRQGSQFR